jgi:hypothetical protein
VFSTTTPVEFNVIDAIFSNDGTLNNNTGGNIKIDSGQIANLVVTPSGDVDSIIKNKGTITIINGGVLNNNDWSLVSNEGTINLTSGTLRNFDIGTFVNYGTIDSKTGYIENKGDFSNHGTIHSRRLRTTRTFDNFGTLNNNYVMELWGTITNQGVLTNNRNSDLEIGGNFTNYDTLVNHWLITNDGTIDNNNLIENYETLTNNGTLDNNVGGTLDNKSGGTLTNNNTLINDGLLNNDGFLKNDGTLINTNATFNTGEILNNGEIQNYGPFLSSDGTINNECSGTIIGSNEIVGAITDACDYTPPIITFSISGVLGDNDWYTSDVTVRWTLTDPESIIDRSGCILEITINYDTDWKAFTCSAKSEGGTSTRTINLRRDATPPTASASVSSSPNADGWYNTDVTVSFSGADDLSELASCDAPVVLSSDGANQSTSGQCTDLAGNLSALATADNIHIDKTAPQVFVTGVLNAETYILGSVPDAGCDTQDSPSGVRVFASLTLSGGDENGVGNFTAACDGAFDYADNNGTASVNYDVITPAEASQNLIDKVVSLNLQQGIENGLAGKLESAKEKLEDGNTKNNRAAIGELQDFLDQVDAQRGKKITDTDADALIADAQAIIDAVDAN